MQFPSSLIENAVNEMAKLPGIGKKSALRLVLHILKQDVNYVEAISEALIKLRTKIQYCKVCHNISDTPVCAICTSPKREQSVICVVEDAPDVLAIENTAQYFGLYHILGGIISPMEGVSPSDLQIDSLVQRVGAADEQIQEIILALSPTIEGDTTAFYITKKLKDFGLKVSTLARGVPIGSELEYTDEVTLGRSILTRTIYDLSGDNNTSI